jgi:hypothetical protein
MTNELKMVLVPEPYRKVLTGPLKGLVVEVLDRHEDEVLVLSRWDPEDTHYCPEGVKVCFAPKDLERYEVPESFAQDSSKEFNGFVNRCLTEVLVDGFRPAPAQPCEPAEYEEIVVLAYQLQPNDLMLLPNNEWYRIVKVIRGLWKGEPRVMSLFEGVGFCNRYFDEQVKIRRPVS